MKVQIKCKHPYECWHIVIIMELEYFIQLFKQFNNVPFKSPFIYNILNTSDKAQGRLLLIRPYRADAFMEWCNCVHLSLVLKASMKSMADHRNVYYIKLTSIYVYVSNKSILSLATNCTFLLLNCIVWHRFFRVLILIVISDISYQVTFSFSLLYSMKWLVRITTLFL